MKILMVIHGYPLRYNAGSEVYTQTLALGLAQRGHEVWIFTRQEDDFLPEFSQSTERDPLDPRIQLHLVNMARTRDGYRRAAVDQAFRELAQRWRPDVVHVGHLNHLSTGIPLVAKELGIPVVFTLHDFWLMCPRGQFLQMFPEEPRQVWSYCSGQDDARCAARCYARYFSGNEGETKVDLEHWTGWVARRMAHVRSVCEAVDRFIAPARTLLAQFRDGFGLPESKLLYLDYGFDRERLAGRSRVSGEPFTFGYIGTHIPAKGIDQLIEAFGRLHGDARLRIWGRPRGPITEALRARARSLPDGAADRIEWMGEYRNQDIVADVFDRCDAIVVPSIWAENSPLVIHEAQQVRVPVVTADFGGMAEYVHHEVNGLLFTHRDPTTLAEQMQRLVDHPGWARSLGERGYLGSPDGQVPGLEEHCAAVEEAYRRALRPARIQDTVPQGGNRPTQALRPGPWRITFDTNPDDCNLHCIMCEEHSPHRPRGAASQERPGARRRMEIGLIRRILAEADGTPLSEIIPSTMGEPLLYTHFEEMVDLCREHGLRLNLTTNGTFPRLGAEAWAERIVPVACDVKISINGASRATQESIMLGSRWDALLDSVRKFAAVRDRHAERTGHRCRLTFQATYLDSNVDELPQLVRLAASLGIDRLKGHHVWVHYPEIAPLSLRRSPESIHRWNGVVDAVQEAVDRHRLPDGQPVLLDNLFPLAPGAQEDLAPGAECPFLDREAWVSAEGRFDPCCAPDPLRRGLGFFGSLAEQSLQDIWESRAYRELAAGYRDLPLCRSCNMRRPVPAPAEGGQR